MSGTEIQALEVFEGRLYAGTTNWAETLEAIWPATSAQVNVLASEDGSWERTPDLPGSSACAPGTAPWEQVNDLHAATFGGPDGTDSLLFAGVLANEDGACPGLQATVFARDERAGSWNDTGLGTRLGELYGRVNTEVRYVETFSDGTADCPPERPCLFAFVGPRGGTVGPSVWRGVFNPAGDDCARLCWDSQPEVVMDGEHAPPAARIVSSASGPTGLQFGTVAAGPRVCRAVETPRCERAALMGRVAPGAWEPMWVGPPESEGGPEQVRGIASWTYPDGSASLWFVTGPNGVVYRIDVEGGSVSDAVAEATLGASLPAACAERMLPYQILVHESGPEDPDPELLVASQACARSPQQGFARIFRRPATRDGAWDVLDMPTVTNIGPDRVNDAAVRCIAASPFSEGMIYFGTTDMNNSRGSLTARVYRLELPGA